MGNVLALISVILCCASSPSPAHILPLFGSKSGYQLKGDEICFWVLAYISRRCINHTCINTNDLYPLV